MDKVNIYILIIIISSFIIVINIEEDPNSRFLYKNFSQIIGADGEQIRITNNPIAVDVTYSELIQFIEADTTDQIIYNDSSFVCADYAELLHNKAEEQGIKTGVVSVNFEESEIGHMFNIFNTIDKGEVLVDITEHDTIVNNLIVGEEIEKESIDGEKQYSINGNVSEIHIYW